MFSCAVNTPALHYGLQDAIDNCRDGDKCLTEDDIAVRRLPPFGETTATGVGWVDALALDATLSGRKRDVAKEFIRFAVSFDAYRQILSPKWMKAPRYLLPARGDLKVENADLYPALFEAFSGRRTGTVRGLNDKLRKIGSKLDCSLPIPAEDEETKADCQKP